MSIINPTLGGPAADAARSAKPVLRAVRYCVGLLFSVALAVMSPAHAVRVDSIYSAEVDLDVDGLQRAFDTALEQVLVKVSGLESLGNAAARRSLVKDSGQLVRQYSRLADNRLRVEFDGVQVRRILDGAGQPVWGSDRPLLAVWYAVDGGAAGRLIIAGDDSDARAGRSDPQSELRDSLLNAAEARGLPMVFPLVDAEDLSRISFSDIWGNFSEPVVDASARYGAEAVLIGRARSLSANDRRVRWTLVAGREQYSWEGSATEGPVQAANWLAQRLATYANASGAVRLAIVNVDSFDSFGRLNKYLRSLNVVQSAQVARVEDDRIDFELIVRGDAGRLSRSLDSGSLLESAADGAAVMSGGPVPDLVYNWVGGRR